MLGDVHLGNIYSDVLSLERLLKAGLRYKVDEVVLLGDVIDGAFKYPTQIFKTSSIRPIDIQREMFRELLLKPLERRKDPPRLVIVRGNHDTNFLEDFLKPAIAETELEVTYTNIYLVDDQLYTHYILKKARGSYATTITPMLAFLGVNLARQYNASKVIVGHLHRGAVHLMVSGVELVFLPSMLRHVDAYDAMYDKCIALIDDTVVFKCLSDKPPISHVQEANINLINKILIKLVREEGDIYR